VGFTRTLGWLLGSVSFTGETRSGIGTSFTNVHTWLTVTVITIIIETIWTETSWGFDSVTGTRETISRRSSTFGTFIRTWLTETVNVGLSGWTWTFWVGVSFSSGSTDGTVVSSGDTSSTLWATLLTVIGTVIEPSFLTFTSWGVSVRWIFTFETFVKITSDTDRVTWFTFSTLVKWLIVTGSTRTGWGVNSVGTTS